MGLDMYLYRTRRSNDAVPPGASDLWDVPGVEQIGYWRKVNAVHAWFVDHAGGGEDRCQLMEVPIADLWRLAARVSEVLADLGKAAEVLPTREGFFFGTYGYDSWYFRGLEETRDILAVLEEPDSEEYRYFYRASW